MNRRMLFAGAALALCAPSHTFAQNLVLNPSFESVSTQTVNTFAGIVDAPTQWTQTGSRQCAFQALSAGQTTQVGADFTIGANASNPSNGARVLISDQGPSNTNCQIFQDVALPANATSLTLTLDAGFVFRSNGTPGSNGLVQVTTTAGVVLFTVYSRTDVQGTDALAARPAVDLTALRGQTVRIIGRVTEVGSNWAGLQMDNVQLLAVLSEARVPALDGWALLALVFLLAMSGAWLLRGRMP